MAQTKKTTNKSKSGRNTTRITKAQREQERARDRLIGFIVITAVSVLLFLSNFGWIGKVGDFLSQVQFGLFGIMAYIVPILIAVGSFFILTKPSSKEKTILTTGITVLFLLIGALIFMISCGPEEYNFKEAFMLGFEEKRAGGLFSNLIASKFSVWFGAVGTWIIIIVLLLISVIVMMGNTAVDFFRDAKERMNEWNEDMRERKAEQRELDLELEQEEQERRLELEARRAAEKQAQKDEDQKEPKKLRSEMKVSGVDLGATKLEKGISGDRVTEISADDLLSRDAKVHFPDKEDCVPVIAEPEEERVLDVREFMSSQRSDFVSDYSSQGDNYDEINRVIKFPTVSAVNDIPATPLTPVSPFRSEPLPSMTEEELAADLEQDIVNFFNQDSQEQNDRLADDSDIFTADNDFATNAIEDYSAAEASTSDSDNSNTTITAKAAPSINVTPAKKEKPYKKPPISLLNGPSGNQKGDSKSTLEETATKLQQTLYNFGVDATVTDYSCGPSVTRFEIQPAMGVKVSRILNLADDIKLNLAATDVRIEAPIPGKSAVGIEVPNKESVMVNFRQLIESDAFKNSSSNIAFAAGRDIAGGIIVSDIQKMPHVLIAGATGSGKSVCINTIIMSILYSADPSDVKLMMIDPKVVELSVYNGIPHLMLPVVTEPKEAAAVLRTAVAEMTRRYNLFAEYGVRDIKAYNAKMAELRDLPQDENNPADLSKLPLIVVIVDELADLMMVASKDVEESICRLAQLARAAGIHLVIATQRPSVNVITGLIKANMPSRIAFAVSSGVDSRTILDMVGAEKLLGKGDMLYFPQGMSKPLRVQGAFVSDEEVRKVVEFLKKENGEVSYDEKVLASVESQKKTEATSIDGNGRGELDVTSDGRDPFFREAGVLIIEKERGSIGFLQRNFKIGFNRAARIMDQLEEFGVVGPEEGTKPRRILMSVEDFEALLDEQ